MALCSNCGWDLGNQMMCPSCGKERILPTSRPPQASDQPLPPGYPQQSAPPPVPGTGAGSGARPGAGTFSVGQKSSRVGSTVGGFAVGCGLAVLVVGAILLYMFFSFLNELGKLNSGMGADLYAISVSPGVAKAAIGMILIPGRRMSLTR